MSEKLDWIEKSSFNNMIDRVKNADLIASQANFTLTLLLAGAGTSLGFAMTKLNEGGLVFVVPLAVSVYLFVLAAILTFKCLMFGAYPAVWNSPKNLLSQPDWDLDRLRQAELASLQDRINDAIAINYRRSEALNKIRLAITFTPVIALLSCLFSL